MTRRSLEFLLFNSVVLFYPLSLCLSIPILYWKVKADSEKLFFPLPPCTVRAHVLTVEQQHINSYCSGLTGKRTVCLPLLFLCLSDKNTLRHTHTHTCLSFWWKLNIVHLPKLKLLPFLILTLNLSLKTKAI